MKNNDSKDGKRVDQSQILQLQLLQQQQQTQQQQQQYQYLLQNNFNTSLSAAMNQGNQFLLMNPNFQTDAAANKAKGADTAAAQQLLQQQQQQLLQQQSAQLNYL